METIAFTTSFRYCSRRVIVHVTTDALRCWGAGSKEASLFATFSEHAQDLQEMTIAMVSVDPTCTEVVVTEEMVQDWVGHLQ